MTAAVSDEIGREREGDMSVRVALSFADEPFLYPTLQRPADTMEELREALRVLAKAYRAALSAAPAGEPWPRATGRAAEDGWTLDPDFLDKAARESETRTGYAVTLESVEDILLDHGLLTPPAAPVAHEPVAWVEREIFNIVRLWLNASPRPSALALAERIAATCESKNEKR